MEPQKEPVPADIPSIMRELVSIVRNKQSSDELCWKELKSLASHYECHATSTEQIIHMGPLEGYHNIEPILGAKELQEEYKLETSRHRREMFAYYSEWAFRYGVRGAEREKPYFEDFKDKNQGDDCYSILNQRSTSMIDNSVATTNDIALAAKLAHEAFSECSDTDILLSFYDDFFIVVQELLEDKGEDIDWNLLGGMFENGSNIADRDTMEEFGREKVIRDIKDADCSPNEWFEKNTK